MAKNVKKLPFPDWLAKTDCCINLDEKGLTEDGEKKVYKGGINCKCIYSECIKRVYDKDGKATELTGKVIVKGDVAPKLKEISSGSIVIDKRKRLIHSAIRAKNPDGTVHHTEFDII